MATLRDIKIDSDASSQGVWIPWIDDVELRIAFFQNAEFIAAHRERFQRLTEKHGGEGKVPDEDMRKLMVELAAEFLLTDWKNLQNDDLSVMECTVANRRLLLSDEELGLFPFVLQQSRDQGKFRGRFVDAARKN